MLRAPCLLFVGNRLYINQGVKIYKALIRTVMNTRVGNSGNKHEPGQHDKDSVETYKDLTKLIITLSTGIFVLSPTFLGLLKFRDMSFWWSLWISWGSLLLSIFLGLLVLSSLAGTQHKNEYNIDNLVTRCFSIPQWLLFLNGILFFGVFVIRNLFFASKPFPPPVH